MKKPKKEENREIRIIIKDVDGKRHMDVKTKNISVGDIIATLESTKFRILAGETTAVEEKITTDIGAYIG